MIATKKQEESLILMNHSCADGFKRKKLIQTYKQSDASNKKFRLEGAGRRPCMSIIVDDLMEKIANEREQQHHISSKLITVYAKQMARKRH